MISSKNGQTDKSVYVQKKIVYAEYMFVQLCLGADILKAR